MNAQEQNGYALVIVMFSIAAITSFLAMLTFSSSQQAFMAHKLSDSVKAKAIAESGCEYAYAILSTDWESRNNANAFAEVDSTSLSYMGLAANARSPTYDPTAVSEGNYNITVSPIGASAALVTTHGQFGNATAEAVIGIQDLGGSSSDDTVLDSEAFSYAILCGGDLDFSGCGTISGTGDAILFHANGEMDLNGTADALINLSSSSLIDIANNVTIGGNITAPAFSYKEKKVTIAGTKTTAAVAPITIPDIDLTPYYNWALDHGEVHNGLTLTSDYTPNGGILWVEGDFHASSHAVVSGSIIATGNINMSGQVDVNPTTCAFGLVSRDGDIQVTSSGTLNGLIYAKTGGLSHTANGEICGQIIVNGDIKKAGNSDIMSAYTPSIPAPPGGSVSTLFIAISAWQK